MYAFTVNNRSKLHFRAFSNYLQQQYYRAKKAVEWQNRGSDICNIKPVVAIRKL
jgi:hypothetical protein